MYEMQNIIKDLSQTSTPNWVTVTEVKKLRGVAKLTRNPVSNELIMLMLYRHGLRVSELTGTGTAPSSVGTEGDQVLRFTLI